MSCYANIALALTESIEVERGHTRPDGRPKMRQYPREAACGWVLDRPDEQY